MADIHQLNPVSAQAGRPLYQTVKDQVRAAIEAGIFRPGEQMPSTKELSDQLNVSLVTAHRALQELVSCGVLFRAQGKGTFVHERYLKSDRHATTWRMGVLFHADASLADYYHSQVVEGIRQAAQNLSIDLLLLRHGEDVRSECNAYLYVNPEPEEVQEFAERSSRKQPTVVVGASSPVKSIAAIDVDNVDLARQAVDYLASMGHQRIGYVGTHEQRGNGRDRWRGFTEACTVRNLMCSEQHVIRGSGWRLDEKEQSALIRILSGPRRPTAIFAAGYFFALNVYSAASTLGLRIPEDLSVVGVDDPNSAPFLSPPLTTLRQPLAQLGQTAVTALYEFLQNENPQLPSRTLRAELIVRRSSGPIAPEK